MTRNARVLSILITKAPLVETTRVAIETNGGKGWTMDTRCPSVVTAAGASYGWE